MSSVYAEHASASFGRRLRAERERRRISIASIAESTKILGALLEGLERDDVSRWPTGLYRRAFIRAYASAIGLDPEPIVREFVELFPDPEDVPVPLSISAGTSAHRTVLRLTLADTGASFAGGDVVREAGRRLTAIAADAAVLGLIGAGLYLVIDQFWAPLTIAFAGYYFGSILVLGNTPGVCLVASRAGREKKIRLWARIKGFVDRASSTIGDLANSWRSVSSAAWRTWIERF